MINKDYINYRNLILRFVKLTRSFIQIQYVHENIHLFRHLKSDGTYSVVKSVLFKV